MLQLAKPNITENAIEEVVKVLRSGNLVQGKKVEIFEKKIAEYIGVKKGNAIKRIDNILEEFNLQTLKSRFDFNQKI